MERLTQKGHKRYVCNAPIEVCEKHRAENGAVYCCSCEQRKKMQNKLGELEDLEEQGLLLKLPCKVEDEFLVVAYRDKKIVHVKCTGYMIQCDVINKINHAYVWLDSVEKESDYWELPFEEFNNRCFLTKSEAEKALAEMGCE